MSNLAPPSRPLAILILTALCALTYLPGLTEQGLMNWQEGMRALVTREMYDERSWLIPTVETTPYLAKPPLIYWAQLALASATGTRPAEWHLRLTVALAGWFGTLATWFMARRLLAEPEASRQDPAIRPPYIITARTEWSAFLAAAMLATGLLYVRSSRIGELDILLAPSTIIAIGATFIAFQHRLLTARTHWLAIIAAALASCAAMLTKGPPALLAIGLGAYGGIFLWAVTSPEARPRRWASCGRALASTHPLLILGAPFLTLWAWATAVAVRIGDESLADSALDEAADNLRFLVAKAPLRNLEAASYAVGLGSITAIIAIIWLIVARPRFGRGWYFLIAWIVFTLFAFSILGKGVPRYLTPLWPALAMLGGLWLGHALSATSRRALILYPVAAIIAALAIGQSFWYGYAREHGLATPLFTIESTADRSPRDFLAELGAITLHERDGRGRPPLLAALDHWSPVLDFYADAHVEAYIDVGPSFDAGPFTPDPVADLIEELRRDQRTAILLIRERPYRNQDVAPPAERLAAMGVVVESIPLRARYTVDERRSTIIAVRLRAPG